MPMPEMGLEVGKIFQKQSGNEPNRLIFQAADSVLLIARAIEQAKSTESADIIKALQNMEFEGVRGKFKFSQEPGYTYQRSEEHTSELQSLMRLSYAVLCLTK